MSPASPVPDSVDGLREPPAREPAPSTAPTAAAFRLEDLPCPRLLGTVMIVGGSWIGFVAEPFEPAPEPEPVLVVDGITAKVAPLVERFGAGVNVAVPGCWPVWQELVHREPFPLPPPPLFEPPRPLDPVL